jgi:putative metalloprotease yggG
MRVRFLKAAVAILCLFCATPSAAQFNIGKAATGAVKAGRALTLTDAEMANYVKEYIRWMDEHNQVCPEDNPYTIRLRKLTQGLTSVEGIPLNFKVYYVTDVNAFACPDGSIRVFSSLMDVMSDDQLLGVIGHEIGHVAHKDSKKRFRTALLTSALKDGIAATSGKASALSESQLGDLGQALLNASYSKKQESKADEYGYEFLKENGKNPWAIALSFERLKQLEEDAGYKQDSKWQQMFSSHPNLDKRIKKMSRMAKDDGFEKPVQVIPPKPVIVKKEEPIVDTQTSVQQTDKPQQRQRVRVTSNKRTHAKRTHARPAHKKSAPAGRRLYSKQTRR